MILKWLLPHQSAHISNSQVALVVKKLAANARDTRDSHLIPGVGNGNPLQYSCLGNPIDRGAKQVTVHGVAKSQTGLGN